MKRGAVTAAIWWAKVQARQLGESQSPKKGNPMKRLYGRLVLWLIRPALERRENERFWQGARVLLDPEAVSELESRSASGRERPAGVAVSAEAWSDAKNRPPAGV